MQLPDILQFAVTKKFTIGYNGNSAFLKTKYNI